MIVKDVFHRSVVSTQFLQQQTNGSTYMTYPNMYMIMTQNQILKKFILSLNPVSKIHISKMSEAILDLVNTQSQEEQRGSLKYKKRM